MISWLFGDIMYWIALAALGVGIALYVLSYMVGFIPMLKPHAVIAKVAGLVLAVAGGYYVADHHGYQRRVAEDQVEIDRLNGEARAKEAELNTKLAKANTQLKQAKNAIQSKQALLNSRVDAGQLRLPSTCGVQAGADASSTTRDPANESDTERQTIKALVGIAADGDSAITQLNACIAQYNQVMQTINEGVK
jgi:hypothetical protein